MLRLFLDAPGEADVERALARATDYALMLRDLETVIETHIDLVTELCHTLDDLSPSPDGQSHADRIVMVPDRPGHDRRCTIEAGKVTGELGWSPTETFETGLRKTVKWYLERSDWWEPIRDRIYRGERLRVLP